MGCVLNLEVSGFLKPKSASSLLRYSMNLWSRVCVCLLFTVSVVSAQPTGLSKSPSLSADTPHSVNQNRPFLLSEAIKSVSLIYPVEYYFESTHSIEAPNINWENSVPWTLHQKKTVSLGYDERVLWLRIPIRNLSKNSDWRLEFSWPLFESIKVFYRQQSDSIYQHSLAVEQHRFPLFLLDLNPNEEGVILIRITSEDRIFAPLTLYQGDWFDVENNEHLVIIVFMIGILLAMALYNFLLGFKTGDSTFIHYCASQAAIALTVMGMYGVGAEFIWPNTVAWSRNMLYFAMTAMPFWYGIFTISFLQLDKYAPQYALLIRRICYAWVWVYLMTHFFMGELLSTLLKVFMLASYLTNLAAAIYCLNKTALMARYHVVIFGLIIIIALANILLVQGFISRNYFTSHLVIFASAFEALLFSFALGERMNILRQQNFQMVASSRIKSDFLSQMSHEIRTPMNGIIGMSELLSGTTLTGQQSHYNRVVRSSGESLLTIVNDILDFSKIEADKMEIESIGLSINQLLSDIVGGFYSLVKDRGINLYVQIDPAVPDRLIGDPTRIRQIITNLVSNAIKFTEQGYVLVTVSLYRVDSRCLEFSIQDTGCGIPPEAIEKLFSAFTQVDESTTRKYGGTGLGLAISRKLVGLMAGEIDVTSRKGKGSNFFFRIPVIPADYQVVRVNPFNNPSQTVIIWANGEINDLLAEYLINFNVRIVRAKSLRELFSLFGRSTKTTYLGAIIDRIKLEDVDFKKIEEFISLNQINSQSRWIFLTSKATDQCLGKHPSWIEMTRWGLVSRYYSFLIGEMDVEPAPIERDFAAPKKVLRILCAEDNTVNQLVIKGYAKKLGHELILVSNGEEAVEAYTRGDNDYDLLLMDCEMPVMDGFEATRSIRSYEQENDKTVTPIIAITAHGFAEQKDKCFNAGMTDHLAKPITLDGLQKKLGQYVTRSEGQV